MQRLRIFYAKTEGLRYTSNLDMQKVWERSLRRANLPVAYSQGFHPQPRIQQGCPLPLGFLSKVEVVDIFLDLESSSLQPIQETLQNAVPSGIEIQQMEWVDLREPALQARGQIAEYDVLLLDPLDAEELKKRIAVLLARTHIQRTRRNKPYDLRPLIESIEISTREAGDRIQLQMVLTAREGATGRPDEILDELGMDPLAARVERTRLEFDPYIPSPVNPSEG